MSKEVVTEHPDLKAIRNFEFFWSKNNAPHNQVRRKLGLPELTPTQVLEDRKQFLALERAERRAKNASK